MFTRFVSRTLLPGSPGVTGFPSSPTTSTIPSSHTCMPTRSSEPMAMTPSSVDAYMFTGSDPQADSIA